MKILKYYVTLLFKNKQKFLDCYELLKILPGIQKFDINNTKFIKIWISNERYSKTVIERLKKLQ